MHDATGFADCKRVLAACPSNVEYSFDGRNLSICKVLDSMIMYLLLLINAVHFDDSRSEKLIPNSQYHSQADGIRNHTASYIERICIEILESPPYNDNNCPLVKFVCFPFNSPTPESGEPNVPLVSSGVRNSITKVPPRMDHLTPNRPNAVSNPPSADGSPERCGTTAHVRPCGEVTVRPST